MRFTLRRKILLCAVLPPSVLALVTVAVLSRSLSQEGQRRADDALHRGSALLESVLASRAQGLSVASQIMTRDPRLATALAVPGAPDDAQVRATVAGIATELNAISQCDVYEVLNAEGYLVSSVGRDATTDAGRTEFIEQALLGRTVPGVLAEDGRTYQVCVMPVSAGGRVFGALLLGKRIGRELAQDLAGLTGSEVTFVSAGAVTGSTIEGADERAALLHSLDRPRGGEMAALVSGTMLGVQKAHRHWDAFVRAVPQSTPEKRQFYVLTRPRDAELGSIRSLGTGLLALGLILALVALLLGLFLAERIVSPLARLKRAAEEMRRGDFAFPIPSDRGDEIGGFTREFDGLREHQRRQIGHLENLVQTRSAFIRNTARDLRAPTGVIRRFHQLLIEGQTGDGDDRRRQALEAIGRSVAQLEHLADDAVRAATLDGEHLRLERDHHDVAVLVQRAVDVARSRATERPVEVVTRRLEEAGKAFVDGVRLEDAVSGLVTAGIRMSPDGGSVDVEARRDEFDLWIEIVDSCDGPDAELRRRQLERTGNANDATDRTGPGVGVAFARAVAEAHGGELAIEGVPARGNRFVLRLPLDPDLTLQTAA